MLVARKDVRAVAQVMLEGLEYGGNHVLYKLGEETRARDARIFATRNEVAEYLEGQPYDRHEFVVGNLRSHYEALALVANGKIPIQDAAVSRSDFHPDIDVAKLVETRRAAEILDETFRRIIRTSEGGSTGPPRQATAREMAYIGSSGQLLRQTEYGRDQLLQLKTNYPAVYNNVFGMQEKSTLKNNTMNENNFSYLARQLENTGYGKEHQRELRDAMSKQNPAFTLFHQQDYGKDSTVSSLHFKKGENSDMYFFNNHTVILKNQQHPDPIRQTFYINNKGDNVTLKEGYNLLAGRAVEKDLERSDGEKYRAWLQLNFKETDKHGNYVVKQYHQNYGFDLEANLLKLPLKLENPDERKRLMESLQRGNRQAVTLDLQGTERRVFIEAAPQFKSLNYYDEHGKRLQLQSVLQTPAQAFGETAQQGQKNSSKQTEPVGQQQSSQPSVAERNHIGNESSALKSKADKQTAGEKKETKEKKTKRLTQ